MKPILLSLPFLAALALAGSASGQNKVDDDIVGDTSASDGTDNLIVEMERDDDGTEKASFFSNGNGHLHTLVAPDGSCTLETPAGDARVTMQPDAADRSIRPELLADGIGWTGGTFRQLFEDTSRGVEHSMIVDLDPDGETVISFSVIGLVAELDGSDAVRFVDDDGDEKISYRGLSAWDALYRQQTAWFELTETGFAIHVETDAGAVGPLTIDPLASSPTTLSVGGQWGWSVATGDLDGDGDVDFLVGEWSFSGDLTNEGRATIVLGSPSGPQLPFQTPAFEGDTTDAECGSSVAIADVDGDGDNDVLIACAGNLDGGPEGLNGGLGGIKVHLNAGGGSFSTTPDLVFFDSDAFFPEFRVRLVAINIDGAAGAEVFAIGRDLTFLHAAQLQFFRFSNGAQPVQTINLNPSANVTTEQFTAQVTLAGGEPAVGVAGGVGNKSSSISSIDDSGAGGRVVVSTSTAHKLVVGQRLQILGANTGGATYNGFYSVLSCSPSCGGTSTQFTTNEVDPGSDNDPVVSTGTVNGGPSTQAQIFRYNSATGLLKTATGDVLLVPSIPYAFNDAFNNNFPALAAGDINNDGTSDLGIGTGEGQQARVFFSNPAVPNSWNQTPTIINGPGGDVDFGSMVLLKDLNKDLHADLMVCSEGEPSGGNPGGRCRVFGGFSGGLTTQIERISNTPGGTGFTGSAEGLGHYFTQFAAADLFLDGANDLVMARPGRPGANQGKVSYFDGDAAGVATTNFDVITGGSSGLALGSNAGSFAVGDIDQDGFDDLVIGVPGFSSANGKVMVFRGGSTMSGTPNLTITGSGNDSFGKGVAIARVRGNTSPPSIIVGEPEFDSPTLNVGRILVFHAPPGGLPTATTSAGADDTIVHNVSSSNFGAAVTKCGNLVDGNGDCVAVGAPQKAGSGGDVFVFGALSNGTGLNHTVAGTASGTASGCSAGLFGNHVAAAGNVENVTGDGGNRVDLLVGSPLCSNGNNSEGKAFLYTGVSGGALSPSTWTFEVNQDGASVGPIAGLGDVTGDGVADFAVGAPEMDNIAVTITNINDSGTGGTVIVTAPGHGITTVGQAIGVHNANIGGATYNKDYTVAQIIDANNVRTAEVDPGSDNDPAVTSGTVFTVAGAGRVYVFKGKSSGTPSTTQTVSMSTSFSGNCGTSIAGGVDFNRDGFMDMIEGEPLFDNGTTNQGRVRIFFGKPGTMDSNPASTFNGGAANRLMGSLVAAGNLDGKADGSTSNGDVYGDVIIGLPGFTGSFNGEGEVLVRVGRW